nr:odorant receptor 22c-like [Nomia melanderi]
MNLHAVTQFRILQHRLANMENLNEEEYARKKCQSPFTEKSYVTLKSYIQQHQSLIAYCQKLEKVFSMIALGQILILSLLICCDGCQVLMADAHSEKRFIFVFHLASCLGQLLMFTYSCDGIMHASQNVARGAYETPWPNLIMDKYGNRIRKDLVFVIARSRVPCCLTAQGFFEVSLGTYTSVLSTAVSYFTLLKHTMENTDND